MNKNYIVNDDLPGPRIGNHWKEKYNLKLNVNEYLPDLDAAVDRFHTFLNTRRADIQEEEYEQQKRIRDVQKMMCTAMGLSEEEYKSFKKPKLCYANKEVEAFHDVVMTSGVARIVITVFDGNHVSNTIIPAWRFEALNPFLNACETVRIIDVYINAETNETSMWAVLVVDNEVNLYKEWLNDKFGIHSRSKEFIRKENQ